MEYGKEVLSLGLLYMEYHNAIKEGDGLRVLLCWKYLLMIFKASQRKNYSIEAFNLLCQYFYYLSLQLAQQLLYSRFVNVHGRVGCNIPCDLHMEHLNRIVKETMQHLGANKTERAIVRSSKCSQLLTTLLSNFDMRTRLKDMSVRLKGMMLSRWFLSYAAMKCSVTREKEVIAASRTSGATTSDKVPQPT